MSGNSGSITETKTVSLAENDYCMNFNYLEYVSVKTKIVHFFSIKTILMLTQKYLRNEY